MSRIVRFHKVGGPEVLQIDNLEVPPPGPNDVRIKVKALGLNRAEAMFRSGQYLEEASLPSKLGYEASGIVEAVGTGVTGLKVGDAVSIVPPPGQGKYGVYGEVATVPARYVVKHPPSLSFVEAAAVWMQYMTAYGALIDIAQIKKGDFVVIPAASSSVGIAAIQLCNMMGAIPIATTRKSDKKRALQEAGAAHVIATEEEDLAGALKKITNGKGARVVFDPVGGKTVLALAEGMAQGGILFIYGALSPEPTPFPLMTALSKSLTMRGYVLFEITTDPARFERAKQFILDALASGKLKPIIAKTFPLEQIVEAHRFLESNQQIGKIVVTVS
jgi:NADPH2:quinone reductase